MDERGAVAIYRVADILELLIQYPKGISLSKIAISLGLPKSTVHRLLSTLESRNFIRQDLDTEVYKLGFMTLNMSTAFLAGFDIITEARPTLERLNKEWDETLHLGVIDEAGKNVIYIMKIDSTKTVRMVSQIGKVVPIHCTALGKAYLSCFDNNLIMKKMSNYDFKRFSPQSITKLDKFIREIELTRQRGFSTDFGENDYDVFCVGAPIYNYKKEPLAAISLSMPSDRFDEKKLQAYGDSLLNATQEISNRLQYIPG